MNGGHHFACRPSSSATRATLARSAPFCRPSTPASWASSISRQTPRSTPRSPPRARRPDRPPRRPRRSRRARARANPSTRRPLVCAAAARPRRRRPSGRRRRHPRALAPATATASGTRGRAAGAERGRGVRGGSAAPDQASSGGQRRVRRAAGQASSGGSGEHSAHKIKRAGTQLFVWARNGGRLRGQAMRRAVNAAHAGSAVAFVQTPSPDHQPARSAHGHP